MTSMLNVQLSSPGQDPKKTSSSLEAQTIQPLLVSEEPFLNSKKSSSVEAQALSLPETEDKPSTEGSFSSSMKSMDC